MSKRGGKAKGGKSGKAPPKTAPSTAPHPVAPDAPEEAPKLKYIPYEGLPYTPPDSNSLVKQVKEWLGLPLKITLTDGRIIVGEFYSLDNYRNVILSNTYQAHITASTHRTCIALPPRASLSLFALPLAPTSILSE